MNTELESGGDVPFSLCPREGQIRTDTLYIKGEAYLFNGSLPESIRKNLIQESATSSSLATWIVYEGENNATMYVGRKDRSYSVVYQICNYPDFAKERKVSSTGQKVYYEGKAFLLGGYLCASCPTWYDMGLTMLKKR